MSILRSIQQLEAVRDEWDTLAVPFGSPLLEHDWFLCSARTLHAEADLRIVTVRSNERLTAVAPLVMHVTPTGQRLGFLGASVLHEPGNLLHLSEAALRDLLRSMTELGVPTVMERVPDESLVCRRASEMLGPRALSVVRSTRPSLGVQIAGTWDAYWTGLSRRLTQNLPRLEAKATRAFGRVSSQVLEPALEDVDTLFDALVRVEATGWKGRQGTALMQRKPMREFFREYSRTAAARGRLRVTLLEFGHEIAAVEFSVQAYERVWQLKIGFDDRFACYYPGLQLTRVSIQAAFERGFRSYEFLGSAEAWEERWRPARRNYSVVALYPCSVRGMAGAARDVVAKIRSRSAGVQPPKTVTA